MILKMCSALFRQSYRCFATNNDAAGKKILDAALKKLYAEHVSVPIVVGNEMIFTGDEQPLRMPHNHRRIAAKYYYATQNHIKSAIKKAMDVQETWANTGFKTRSEIFHKAAAKLSAPEKKYQLTAAIMLSQAKTLNEAEKDVAKMIKMLKEHADYLIKLSELKLSKTSDKIRNRFLLRPLDGFVIASGPMYMSWIATNLAIAPLIMGNVVLWRPPINSMLSSFIVFKAIVNSGVPRGALQFLPSNYKLFFDTTIKSPELAGINYAGRLTTLRKLWYDVSTNLAHYKCFPRLVGECESKGFHFVHESGDVDLILECTLDAAFRFCGQRTYSCGRFYVPCSLWNELQCEFLRIVNCLQIGDPLDENSFASAIIREDLFEEVVKQIEQAKCNDNVEILCGGIYNKTHGYFVQPTIVLCKNPDDRMMIDDIMGPILSVYVYDNDKLDETLAIVKRSQKFGACGSVFSCDMQATEKLLTTLRMTTSNLYVNERCTGSDNSHLPLSGNRLSGTNDKNGSAYYLLRFAAPQLIEEPASEDTQKVQSKIEKCV